MHVILFPLVIEDMLKCKRGIPDDIFDRWSAWVLAEFRLDPILLFRAIAKRDRYMIRKLMEYNSELV